MIRTRQYILAIGDLAMLFLALFAMVQIRFTSAQATEMVRSHMHAFFPLFIIWIIVFFVFNLYDIRSISPNPRNIGRLGMSILVNIIVGGFFFYLQPTIGLSPQVNLLITGIFAFIFVILWRRLFFSLFASVFSRKIVLIGESSELLELKKHIDEQVSLGKVVLHAKTLNEIPSTSVIEDTDLVITDCINSIDIVQIEKNTDARVLTLVAAYSEIFAKIPLSLFTESHAVRIAMKTRNYTYPFIMRIIEIAIAIFILVITSPILLIAGFAKKIEDGGVILLRNHLRVGKNGSIFSLIKMRSMIMHADASGNQWTEKSDPRITRIGRIIRKLHIDEIPQLWNVITGDLALVGPRPEQPEFVEKLEKDIPYYYMRHIIKPGFTGWAQIKFRYARTVSDSKQKFEYDLYYLENRSPLLDLGILVKTIQIIFTH